MITAKNGEIRANGSVAELLTDTAGIVSAVKSALVNAGTPEMVAFDLLTRTALVGFGAEGEVKEFSAVGVAPWMK
uniref:hypothetical protein n=1 Tax=Candidatus Limivicinus sp. TaxID=3030905 RepID=UPI003FEDBCB1